MLEQRTAMYSAFEQKNKNFHPRLPQPNVSTFIEHILDMLNFKLSFS